MTRRRREVLRAAGALAGIFVAGMLKPVAALAAIWNKEAFGAKDAAGALKALDSASPTASTAIAIEAPQIAENGEVVPIEISSNIPGTTSLAVLIDKNPFPLAGKVDFMQGALPFVKINVKMRETSDVRVIATAGGKHYVAVKEIKVTIGGCGG